MADAAKQPGPVSPPALFHAAYRDLDFAVGGDQDGRVQDAVPLGPDQFLAFQQQNPHVASVLDQQIGHRSGLGHFLDGHHPDPMPSSESVYSTGVMEPSNGGNTDWIW